MSGLKYYIISTDFTKEYHMYYAAMDNYVKLSKEEKVGSKKDVQRKYYNRTTCDTNARLS